MKKARIQAAAIRVGPAWGRVRRGWVYTLRLCCTGLTASMFRAVRLREILCVGLFGQFCKIFRRFCRG